MFDGDGFLQNFSFGSLSFFGFWFFWVWVCGYVVFCVCDCACALVASSGGVAHKGWGGGVGGQRSP